MNTEMLLMKEKIRTFLHSIINTLYKPIDYAEKKQEDKEKENRKKGIIPKDTEKKYIKGMVRLIVLFLVEKHLQNKEKDKENSLYYAVSGETIDRHYFYPFHHLGDKFALVVTRNKKRSRSTMKHFYDLKHTIELQMKIIDALRENKYIEIEEVDVSSLLTPSKVKELKKKEFHKAFKISFTKNK